ncbi:MAG: IS630 family transposase, partial [Chloroflexia bacterium]|nr:IS630 family transposase [Chloroflexia bacterium]
VTAAIREALARPTGVASYGDIVDWLWKEHSIRLASDKPVKIWTQDESRWGLMTILRRRITLKGVKPIITTQHQYANCWLYGAVAPQRGERFFLFLPRLDTMNMQIFLDMFAGAHPDTLNVMLMDRSGAHTAKHLGIPATTALVFFAPACPELNPTERVWEDLHGKLAGQCCAHLDCLEEEICAHLDLYTDPAVQSLTG